MSERVTADTITDEQIRELMVEPAIVSRNTCFEALPGGAASPDLKRWARARCAEILNARTIP